jgi:hypothetical protein
MSGRAPATDLQAPLHRIEYEAVAEENDGHD